MLDDLIMEKNWFRRTPNAVREIHMLHNSVNPHNNCVVAALSEVVGGSREYNHRITNTAKKLFTICPEVS